MDVRAVGDTCLHCIRFRARERRRAVRRKIKGEERTPPSSSRLPSYKGEGILLSDIHIPYHRTDVILGACKLADTLGIRRLFILGDFLDGSAVSSFLDRGATTKVVDEILATGKVLSALREIFDEIILIQGNHDHRLEKFIASLRGGPGGRTAFDMLAAALDVDRDSTPGELARDYLARFLEADGVELHELSECVLNDFWYLYHPGGSSINPPTFERAIANKKLMGVIGGHSHLWGLGFHQSASFPVWNMGHACKHEEFRYPKQKISKYPNSVPGYGAIYQTPEVPEGKLLPIAVHPKMFDLSELISRAARQDS